VDGQGVQDLLPAGDAADEVLPVGAIGPASGLIAVRAYQAWKDRHRAGDDDELCLAITTAEAKTLRFANGHPLKKVVYAADPALAGSYHPIATFHQILFESKVAEGLRFLSGLGATETAIEYIDGFERAAGVDITGSDVGGVEVGGTFDVRTQHRSSARTTMKLTPTGAPRIADDLVWLHSEPLWMAIAHARLESGLRSFSLELAYKDDFGVNAKLKARIATAGLELGGNFTDYRETVWKLSGTFSEA
jgi:hypothetical protein